MKKSLFDLIAPHYCCSCGEIGRILCDYCKNDIVAEPYSACIACGNLATNLGICKDCETVFSRAWCVGERTDALKDLINLYKFERARAAYTVITEMLDEVVAQLPDETIVTSVPTIAAHVRQRGFDHAQLIAREFARRRKIPYQPTVRRASNLVQHGATRAKRQKQAARAFTCEPVRSGVYLLVDDIFTTGATANYASQALLDAGATEVWLAIGARQPFDDTKKNPISKPSEV